MLFGSRQGLSKFFFLLMLLFSCGGKAGLDEVVLSSPDQRCAIRYLTTYPKNHWFIQTNALNCPDGFVHGYAQVEIYNSTQELSEKMTGFFMDGYWLDSFMAEGHVLDRTTPQEHEQALSFILSKEKDITYVAQLRSIQEENRSYGAFTGCPDFRVLVVVQDLNLFKEAEFQEKIVSKTLEYAKSLCPNLEQVALFGTNTVKPQESEIVFQMQIDALIGERTVISDEKREKTKATVPVELRQEKAEVLFEFPPKVSQDNVAKPRQKDLPRTALAHLDILSRTSNKTIKGRVIVHVNQLNLDGTAQVDLPQKILLKNYPNLKTGWMEVEGDYFDGQMSVSKVKECLTKWCSDVS